MRVAAILASLVMVSISPAGAQDDAIDLGKLALGAGKNDLAAAFGRPRSVRGESHYTYRGLDIRVAYDKANLAISVFVGLGAEPDQIVIASPGPWPIRWQGGQRKWSDLRFADVGGEHCTQHIKTGATKGLRAISCPYERPGSGGARPDRNEKCWVVAGYSDGVLGVTVTDNEPDISETDMMQWKEERKSAQQIRSLAWEKLAAGAFNYLMLSCDRKLLKVSY